MHDTYLIHYGVKGMKWGVRRYQPYSVRPRGSGQYGREIGDALHRPEYRQSSSPKPSYSQGRTSISSAIGASRAKAVSGKEVVKRWGMNTGSKVSSTKDTVQKTMSTKLTDVSNRAQTVLLGKNKVDTVISSNVEFSRIQSANAFEKQYAFYATYKKHDVNQYAGLFGKNLKSRKAAEARAAEKKAKKTKNEADIAEAQKLRKEADNMQIYQLKITNSKELKIPSDQNAGRILADLTKDKDFKSDLQKSLDDSKAKMKRPTQQMLFKDANRVLAKDPSKMTEKDRVTLYRAANLTLANHNDYEVNMQDKFYKALKKNGYSALVDINDKDYSSYHAKRPMIVFDTSSTKLKSVSKMSDDTIDKLYSKYNKERIRKEITTNAIRVPTSYGSRKVSDALKYVDDSYDRYMKKR